MQRQEPKQAKAAPKKNLAAAVNTAKARIETQIKLKLTAEIFKAAAEFNAEVQHSSLGQRFRAELQRFKAKPQDAQSLANLKFIIFSNYETSFAYSHTKFWRPLMGKEFVQYDKDELNLLIEFNKALLEKHESAQVYLLLTTFYNLILALPDRNHEGRVRVRPVCFAKHLVQELTSHAELYAKCGLALYTLHSQDKTTMADFPKALQQLEPSLEIGLLMQRLCANQFRDDAIADMIELSKKILAWPDQPPIEGLQGAKDLVKKILFFETEEGPRFEKVKDIQSETCTHQQLSDLKSYLSLLPIANHNYSPQAKKIQRIRQVMVFHERLLKQIIKLCDQPELELIEAMVLDKDDHFDPQLLIAGTEEPTTLQKGAITAALYYLCSSGKQSLDFYLQLLDCLSLWRSQTDKALMMSITQCVARKGITLIDADTPPESERKLRKAKVISDLYYRVYDDQTLANAQTSLKFLKPHSSTDQKFKKQILSLIAACPPPPPPPLPPAPAPPTLEELIAHGRQLAKDGEFEAASAAFWKILLEKWTTLTPAQMAQVQNHLGNSYHCQAVLESKPTLLAAEDAYQRALLVEPGNIAAQVNVRNVRLEQMLDCLAQVFPNHVPTIEELNALEPYIRDPMTLELWRTCKEDLQIWREVQRAGSGQLGVLKHQAKPVIRRCYASLFVSPGKQATEVALDNKPKKNPGRPDYPG